MVSLHFNVKKTALNSSTVPFWLGFPALLLVKSFQNSIFFYSSINDQRSENYKSTGNPKPISSSSSDSKVHPRRVFGAYKRTHSTLENNSFSNITDNSTYGNRYKTSESSYDSDDVFLGASDTNSKGKSKPPKFGKVGDKAVIRQAKQITYQPYHRFPSHYIQKKIHPTISSIDMNSSENTRNVVLPKVESGRLNDSYMQEIPISMVYSGHTNSLNDLQDSYLQGSSATMVNTALPNSLDDLQDSYLQGSSTGIEHSAQSNSLYDLQDNYLSPQSNSFNGLQNNNLLGSSTGMEHSALPNTIGDLQDSYLQGSLSGAVHNGHSDSLNDLQDSYLQGSAEASSLNDVKDNYLQGSSVAKTPMINSNYFDSLQDSYLQGSNTLDVPVVHSNSYDNLENNYLQGVNAEEVPKTQSNGFGDVNQQDSYFQEDSAADPFVPGGLGLESEAQGIVSGSLQMDQQQNYTALPTIPSDNQSFSSSPMPPVPIYYQTPPPLPMLSSTYNYALTSSLPDTSAPYYNLIPPPTSNSQPSMSSEPYTNPVTLPQPTLETSVAYEYNPPPPPTVPTTITAVSYDYQPPLEAPKAYDYPVPSPPTLTSGPYYYNPPPVPPSLQYLPAPTLPPATSPPATTIPTVEFVPYNVGAKIWFIPLVFSAYFAVYITALILKSIIKHKYFFPTNLLVAATDMGREQSTNLDYLSKIVTRAIATAVIKYVRGKT